MNLVERVAWRYLEAAVPKGPPEGDVHLHEPLGPGVLEHVEKAAKEVGLTITPEGTHKLLVHGPEGMKEKDFVKAFDLAWGRATMKVHEAEMEAWGRYLHEHPGEGGQAAYKAWSAQQPPSGLGSVLHRPKLDLHRTTQRQQGTGRYLHTKWTRLCRTCGHPVGVHSAEKASDGSQPCFIGDYTGKPCPCEKFVPTNKFMDDAEYERLTKTSSVSSVNPSVHNACRMDKLAFAVAARFEAMQQVGEVSVDSGTLLVIDPAYLDSWGTGEHPDLSMDGYRAAWHEGRNQLNFANGNTAAVFIKGFGGDGTYPVMTEAVQADEHGELLGSLAIDFTGPNVGSTDPLVERVAAKYKQKIKTDSGNTVYTYSDKQIAARNKKKAERIEALRKSIGDLRRKVKKDIKSSDPEKSMTALAVALIDHTYERVGGDEGAKEGHYGVTGWKKKHVSFGRGTATIKYVGKSGVKHEKKVTDGSIKQALREAYEACDGDNKCLFSGEWGSVTAEKVNEYLEPFDITAKDIRGFHANREMQQKLKAARGKGGKLPTDKKAKEKLLKSEFLKALDETAEAVGHEAATLRSQYLVPGLEEQYVKDGKVSDKMSCALEPEGSMEERLAARFMLGLL